jgi:uncharacterized protein YlxW (UPF0749 family)
MREWVRRRAERVRERVRRNQSRRRTLGGRIGTVAVCVLAGVMMTVAALAARGTDLRSDRTADMRDLIVTQSSRNEELRRDVAALTEEVGGLAGRQPGNSELTERLAVAEEAAGLTDLVGPGLRVTLTDAPADVKPAGVSDDALVVHQQDIQAVVNALWAGGAEAMTIQGQRVISTTGIKCVGNTVVLHGVPYAPPYVIEAIGDADSLLAAINDSPSIQIYKQYVDAYGLGYAVDRVAAIEAPAFSGSVGLRFAAPAP